MSNRKVKKVEGGHKKGHSNMCHWMGTEEIKAAAKKVRRQQDHKSVEHYEDAYVIIDRYPIRSGRVGRGQTNP